VRAGGPREGDEVIVVRIGSRTGFDLRIGQEEAHSANGDGKGGGLFGPDVPSNLFPTQHLEQLVQQLGTDHQLELSGQRCEVKGGWCSGRGEQRRYEDAGVENRSKHLTPSSLPSSPELLVRKLGGFFLGNVYSAPDLLENIESQVLSERFLEHLIVSPPRSSGLNLGSPKEILVQVHGCFGPCHNAILME
jgi:hypothetical protein